MKITGNTILITGGGSGIGRELAQRLHDLGNRIIVTGRRSAELLQTAAGRPNISGYALDLRDQETVRQFARTVVNKHPDLNVLVNNAGIMRFEDASVERDLGDAEETVATNLLSPIRLTNALIAHLTMKDNAAILNMTSGLAFVPWAAVPTYSATKAALHSYTVSLRHKLDGKVEVIEIAPPGVRTELTPGQSEQAQYMTLTDFIDEMMLLLQTRPTPAEILVDHVKGLRFAEAEGHFDKTLAALNAH